MKTLICKDHTVSGEIFELRYNKALHLYATYPQPPESELYKYYLSTDYISHTDAQASLLDKIYQWVKTYSIAKKIKLINALPSSDKTLLDVGCGTGSFLEAAQKQSWQVYGVEPNKQARQRARQKLQPNTSLFSKLDELCTDTYYGKFDVITLWHVLEHVPDYNLYITQLKKLLTPKGTLLIAVPNFKSYDAQYYQQFWAAYDVPRHLWHFSKNAIQTIFSNHAMVLYKIKPMIFDAFYVALLSEKNKTGRSRPVPAFFIGLLSNIKAKTSGNYASLIYFLKKS